MKCTVMGVVVETNGLTPEQLQEAKTFCGKNAGICYQKEGYFGTSVSDPVQASKRFTTVSGTGHHSIADHVRVEVLLEDVSKMLAIVLNSLQDYATSEKSGRYTVMTGNSERECGLYEKWCKIFQDAILKEEPSIDDAWLSSMIDKKFTYHGVNIENGECLVFESKNQSEVYEYYKQLLLNNNRPSRKLAQENARYVLSVFTRSTTLGYSTSIRQWNYIYDWCLKYMSQYEEQVYPLDNPDKVSGLVNKSTGSSASYFESELYKDFKELSDFIKENLYVEELRDTKDRYFEFLTSLSGDPNHPMSKYRIVEPDILSGEVFGYSEDDDLGITYQVSYPASFVHIAQAERHRTLKYFMKFNPYCNCKSFFVPPCIKDTDLEGEWLKDLQSVGDLVPQATIIGIVETGHISDFILKCEERCCGRAQWEIMHQTEDTAKRFIEDSKSDEANAVVKEYVKKITAHDGSVATKCMMLGGCKEHCRFGSDLKGVFTRKF